MNNLKKISHTALLYIENLGLIIVALSTVVAIAHEVYVMISNRFVTLADLLLLFIYLEVISMVAVYLKSGKLPVRMPLYIAMVALARYLILDMKNLDTWRLLGIAGAVLLIAITVLVVRYGHCKFSYDEKDRE